MYGLILAGGQSSRMGGHPKGLMAFQGQTQASRTTRLLFSVCDRVFLSCQEEQAALFPGFELIFDDKQLGDIGPIRGVLSAFKAWPNAPWMVLGCDYPLLQEADIKRLATERDPDLVCTAYAYPDPSAPEPLLAVYEPRAYPALLAWLSGGQESLRRFILAQPAKLLMPESPERLQSMDTPAQWARLVLSAK